MKINGQFTCKNPNCNKLNKWIYLLPQHISENLVAHTIPNDHIGPYHVHNTDDNYILTFHCKFCDEINTVTYEK